MANPIQQGLKPGVAFSGLVAAALAAMANPIQQGLKLQAERVNRVIGIGRNG